MQKLENLKTNVYYLASQKLTKKEFDICKKNTHCIEYFIITNKLKDCTPCYNILNKNKLLKLDEIGASKLIKHEKNIDKCKQECLSSSFVYPITKMERENSYPYFTQNIDKLKTMENFKQTKLLYKLEDIDFVMDYELTVPKPKTVVHWGQLKMFLVTLIFLIKTVSQDDHLVNIVYPGSAHGDNILILSKMFPNINWYLIDPNPYHPDIYKCKKIIEVKNEYFTDELAEHYHKKLSNGKNKLLFISDIRVGLEIEDAHIVRDQDMNKKWVEILKPDFSYLKFRTPYSTESDYEYLDGTIYIQPYAPVSSTETRLLIPQNLEMKTYSTREYNGKMFYFNRALRPAYYPSIINNHPYIDHCFDCTYFTYLIKNYITHFDKINPLGTDVKHICQLIINTIVKKRHNKLKIKTNYLSNHLFDII